MNRFITLIIEIHNIVLIEARGITVPDGNDLATRILNDFVDLEIDGQVKVDNEYDE